MCIRIDSCVKCWAIFLYTGLIRNGNGMSESCSSANRAFIRRTPTAVSKGAGKKE